MLSSAFISAKRLRSYGPSILPVHHVEQVQAGRQAPIDLRWKKWGLLVSLCEFWIQKLFNTKIRLLTIFRDVVLEETFSYQISFEFFVKQSDGAPALCRHMRQETV